MLTIVAIILFVLLVALAVIATIWSVKIVPQATARIVERFGRYQRTLQAGVHVVIPFADQIRSSIDLREQVVDFPPQPFITRDNLEVGIDSVIYFRVANPEAAIYAVASYKDAVEQLVVTTLRNVVGGMDLDTALTSRDRINARLHKELGTATDQWGLQVTRVELKAIKPPASIQDSLEKQMRAEQDKRAAILSAEGAKQAAILSAEGVRQAAVLRARGDAEAAVVRAEAEATAQATWARGHAEAVAVVSRAIHESNPDQPLLAYKYLEMLPQIARGDANKLWIVPSELGRALEGIGGILGTANPDADADRAHAGVTGEASPLPATGRAGAVTRLTG